MRSRYQRTKLLGPTVIGAAIGILVALAIAFGVHRLHHQPTDLHEMLHEAVPLDPQERQFLDIKEREFQWHRQQIEARLQAANEQLADAIARDPQWNPQVEAATQQEEKAAADLQRATLVHVFEMRAGLKPEHRAAYDKVLVDALRHGTK